ncbi:MAG: hypothetical protein R3D55_10475 [Chloroflexota bacterium]
MQNLPSNTLPVPRQRMPRLFTLAALALALLLGFLFAGTAHASGSGFYYGKWIVNLTFPNNVPLAELTTEIWYKPASGSPVLAIVEVEELSCTTVGNLQIANERATFSGQEYISCDMPDMVLKFAEVSQGILNVPFYDAVTRSPYVSGQIALASSAPLNVTLPLFYHPSIQHGMAQVGAGTVVQTFRVNEASSTSLAFLQAAPYVLRSEFRSLPVGNYRALFTANGSTTLGTPPTLGPGLEVNLEETPIYFGYSPDTNSYFQGTIKSLTADPGAFGRD